MKRLVLALLMAGAPGNLIAAQGAQVECHAARTRAPVIDSAQLIADLSILAADSMEGRAFGTPGGARARAYLVRRMGAIGLDTLPGGRLQAVRASGERSGANVIGVIPGRDPHAGTIVVSAHYDHLGAQGGQVFNGADDNASGTAALLALASWFRANPPRHRLVLVAFDGEELGLVGSREFVESPPVSLDDIRLNLNFDMVSRSDRGEVYVVGPARQPSLLPLVERAACGAEVRLMLGHDKGSGGVEDWTAQSDQAAFLAKGIPFLYFGVEDHADYHRVTDDVERIDAGFFVRVVRTLAAAAVAADATDASR